jgi:hypothetical protein
VKNPFIKKRFGRVFIAAALGAAVFTCAMLITNLYIDSFSFAAKADKPGWVYIFMSGQDTLLSFLLRFLRLFGFGRIQSMAEFRILASLADGLAAFVYLLVPGFIWQLFKCYERNHQAVA